MQGSYGKGVLTLRITRHRVSRMISTPYVLSSDEWDSARQRINSYKKSSPKRKKELAEINDEVKKEIQLIFQLAEILEIQGDYSAQDLVTFFRSQKRGQLFCDYIYGKVEYLKKIGHFGTAHAYEYAAISFMKFNAGKDVCIEKINNGMMINYEHHLKTEKKSRNTISCYMRSLRAVYNQSIAEKVFIPRERKINPFAGIFTGNAKTGKRAIKVNDISKLMEVEISLPVSPLPCGEGLGERFSLDLFLFSFYTQGMSFSDMANLKTENIKGNILTYYRKKTGQKVIIEMEECMKEIIDRYSDSNSNYIFPILRNYHDCCEFIKWKKTGAALTVYNKNLSKLARLAGIGKSLTSYVARHSWASIASQEGIPIATIGRGMGHESERTTLIYISQLDSSDVGKANRKILSRISGEQIPTTQTT